MSRVPTARYSAHDWQYDEMVVNHVEQAYFGYMDFAPSNNAGHDAARLEYFAACLARSHRPGYRLLSAWAHIESAARTPTSHSRNEQRNLLATASEQAEDIMSTTRSVDMYWKAAEAWLGSKMIAVALGGDEATAAEQGIEIIDELLSNGVADDEGYDKSKGALNELAVTWVGLNAVLSGHSGLYMMPASGRLDHTNWHGIHDGTSKAVDVVAQSQVFGAQPVHGIQVKTNWQSFETQGRSGEFEYGDGVVKIAANSHLGDDLSSVDSSMAKAIVERDEHRISIATRNVLSELR